MSPSSRGDAQAHVHAWSPIRFELVDDRPVVRQTCATCGLVRGYRAWERYWTPGRGGGRADARPRDGAYDSSWSA